jgi:hypothetical protein
VLIVVMLLFPAGIQGGVRRLLSPVAPAANGPISAIGRRLARRLEESSSAETREERSG